MKAIALCVNSFLKRFSKKKTKDPIEAKIIINRKSTGETLTVTVSGKDAQSVASLTNSIRAKLQNSKYSLWGSMNAELAELRDTAKELRRQFTSKGGTLYGNAQKWDYQ